MRRMRKRIAIIYSVLSLPLLAYADLYESTPPTNTADSTTTTNATAIGAAQRKAFMDSFNNWFNATDQPAWSTRTNIFYNVQEKNSPVTGFATIQPLYECGLCTLFGQGRGGYSDGSTVFNLGLGYRYLTPSKDLMLGINTFFDEVFRYPHKRVGLGAEVFTPYITLRANYYGAYTGQHYAGDNVYQRASSGFDAGVETPFPMVSWMRFTVKGYHWKGNQASNVNGGLASVKAYFARQLELEAGCADDNSHNAQAFLNVSYYFGSPDFVEYSASTPHPWELFTAQNLEKMRLEKVIRTNQIVYEKTEGGSTYTDLVASTST